MPAPDLQEAAQAFASPCGGTVRVMLPGPPEGDVLRLEVTMADWFRLNVALGNMDEDYLRCLPPRARPSEAFLASICDDEAG